MIKAIHFLLFLLLMLPLSVSAEKILIFRQGSQNFEEVVKAVKMEIGDELEIVDQVLHKFLLTADATEFGIVGCDIPQLDKSQFTCLETLAVALPEAGIAVLAPFV